MEATASRNNACLTRFQAAGLVLLTVLAWLICTVAQLEKYLAISRSALASLAGCIFVTLCMLCLRWTYLRKLDMPRWPLVFLFAVLALSFGVLYPKSLHHELKKGSDREDALRVELVAVTHHQYPYDARTFRGNPPTPLPGAAWLAAPFFLLGRIALQNLVWAAVFMLFLCRFFHRRSTVFAFVLLFLLTALENLNDFDVGGDYITNILYISVAVYLFTLAVERRHAVWFSILSVTLLGVALSSRAIYVVVVLPLAAFTWQRTSARRTVVLFAGVVTAAALATLPVFWPHPLNRLLAQLAQNADKFNHLPGYLPGKVLPPLALLFACVSFFVRVDVARIYLISGIATLIMLLPPMVGIVLAQGGVSRPLSPDIEYLAVSALLLGLWIFSRWEEGFLGANEGDLI